MDGLGESFAIPDIDMGGWVGGHAEYVMVPYADFNLLKFPDRDQAMEKVCSPD